MDDEQQQGQESDVGDAGKDIQEHKCVEPPPFGNGQHTVYFPDDAQCLCFLRLKFLEILNSKKISPLPHVPVVWVRYWVGTMLWELLNTSWKTWPPVSISQPREKELCTVVETT